ncbi:SMI1/KNR4 family protein [Streptomyces globosus]
MNRPPTSQPPPPPPPLTEAEVAEAESDAREPQWEAFRDGPTAAAAWSAWDAEYEEFQDRKTAGSVVLQEHGCGYATLLALSGPLAGTMWWDGRASHDLIVPLSLDHEAGGRPATFAEWLQHDSWDLLPDWGRPNRSFPAGDS